MYDFTNFDTQNGKCTKIYKCQLLLIHNKKETDSYLYKCINDERKLYKSFTEAN